MKLTYRQIPTLLQAHALIDSAVKSGSGSGEVRIKIAHNLKKLRETHETLMETKKKLFLEISGGRETLPQGDPAGNEISARFDEIDRTQSEIKLWSIDYASLNPDNVSPQAIDALSGIIRGVPDLGEPDC